MKKSFVPEKYKVWIEARKRLKLSHARIQMARELGMNPKKLDRLDDHDQKSWKLPLGEFIDKIYLKRFGKSAPDTVRSIEELAAAEMEKRAAKKARKEARISQGAPPPENAEEDGASLPF